MKIKNLFSFFLIYRAMVFGLLIIALNACSGVTGKRAETVDQGLQPGVKIGKWTRISEGSMLNQPASCGTKGVASSTNNPGARYGSTSWTDSQGILWLFGGDSGRNSARMRNDLWKFDGTRWIWVSGDDTPNQKGIYGIKGIAASANKPGARYGSVGWIDSKGNMWLFGGYGYSERKIKGQLNDLWKFDGKNWTWVSGSSLRNRRSIMGNRGMADKENIPGGRNNSISWVDSKDNLWLFGGFGYAGSGFLGLLNDLWKFDGTNWIWVSGDFRTDQEGVYGSQGNPDSNKIPGARQGSVCWIDSKDNLWLFGGVGADKYRIGGFMNDLWKFDGSNWTWVSGEYAVHNWQGVYGIMGVPDKANRPKARSGSISWTDSNDNLWLFGGVNSNLNLGQKPLLNDLWKFDGISWTWISGDNPEHKYKVEDPNDPNHPRARVDSVSWADKNGDLWLFGGRKLPNDYFNDLWKFEP